MPTLRAGISFPGRVSRFLLSTPKRTDHLWGPPWLSVGTGGSFLGRKAARVWSYLPQSSAQVKNEWSFTATPSRSHHNIRRYIMLEALRAQMWRGTVLYCSWPFIVPLLYIYCIALVHLLYYSCTFIVLLLSIYCISLVRLFFCSCQFIVLLFTFFVLLFYIYCISLMHLLYCCCTRNVVIIWRSALLSNSNVGDGQTYDYKLLARFMRRTHENLMSCPVRLILGVFKTNVFPPTLPGHSLCPKTAFLNWRVGSFEIQRGIIFSVPPCLTPSLSFTLACVTPSILDSEMW